MSEDHEIELRLRWRHTWEEKDNDFVAEAPGHPDTVGRIYESIVPGGTGTHWFWAMNAHGAFISRAGKNSGYEATPRQAAKAVEDAWFQAIRGSSHEVAADEKLLCGCQRQGVTSGLRRPVRVGVPRCVGAT